MQIEIQSAHGSDDGKNQATEKKYHAVENLMRNTISEGNDHKFTTTQKTIASMQQSPCSPLMNKTP